MKNLKLYAVRDLKSKYATPIAMSNDDVAKRWFLSTVKKDITMSFEPSDFDLYCVGEYNQESGLVIPIESYVICNGKEAE